MSLKKRIVRTFMTSEMKSWETTVSGLFAALAPFLKAIGVEMPDFALTWGPIIGGVAFAYYSKSAKATGGTKSVTEEAKKRLG